MMDGRGQQGRPALPLDHRGGSEGESPELLRGFSWGAEVNLHQVLGHRKASQPTYSRRQSLSSLVTEWQNGLLAVESAAASRTACNSSAAAI